MDYDDLLANWLIVMLEYPAVRAEISGSFDHVLVDEYQDINPLQARILDEAQIALTRRDARHAGDQSGER